MAVSGIDERSVVTEKNCAAFIVFIYEGGDTAHHSWSVDSYLLTDIDLPRALAWVRESAPPDSCWSLGIVLEPADPTSESELQVAWIIGSDVLNINPAHRSPDEERLAQEMLARRERIEVA